MRSGSRGRSGCARRDSRIGRAPEGGYAMAALLVSLAVLSVVASMALPAWRHAAQREREAELVFRGEQYARAIMLYQREQPGAFPSDLETLVEGRYLRRAYRDPMTEDGEFRLILQSELGGTAGGGDEALPAGTERTGSAGPAMTGDRATGGDHDPGGVEGGVAGVASRSTTSSIGQYNGAAQYDQWLFVVDSVGDPPTAPGLQ